MLKFFIWEYVLGGGLSDGMVAVCAETLEQALEILKREYETAYNVVKGIEPEVVESPKAFVVYGFG